MPDGPPRAPRAWRDGGARRVTLASAAAGLCSAAYLSARAFPAPVVVRAGASAAMLAAPLFALREAVAESLAVRGPLASALVGGVAGYVGAVAATAASHRAASQSALFVGAAAGLVDALASGLDERRKRFLVRRADAAAAAAAATQPRTAVPDAATLARSAPMLPPPRQAAEREQVLAERQRDALRRQAELGKRGGLSGRLGGETTPLLAASSSVSSGGSDKDESLSSSVTPASSTLSSPATPAPPGAAAVASPELQHKDDPAWPLWLPALARVDDEYKDLLRRREATVAALRHEQDRIARLLDTIEQIKTSGRPASCNATPRTPPPVATASNTA